MKKMIWLMMLLLAFSADAMAQTCPSCHGGGRVKIPGMSGFGVSLKQRKCGVCGEWYNPTSDHWHKCPSCKGTGRSGSGSSGGGGRSGGGGSVNENTVYQYLTPAEAMALQNLLQMRMKGTKTVQQTCYLCKGSGICQGCRGTGMIFGSQPCPGCNMMGTCGTCMGSRVVYQQVPLNQQELKQLDDQIAMYMKTAQQRM